MHKTLQAVTESLDDLASSILKGYSGDGTMVETWGWNTPPLKRQDLAAMALAIANRIREQNIVDIDEDFAESIEEIPTRIQAFKTHTLPYLYNGHGTGAAPNYIALLNWIETIVAPLFSWEVLQDNKALPKELSRRLRAIQSELTSLMPEKEDLKSQIEVIQKATAAAETLPTDLESLKEARNKVDKFSTDAAELFGKIQDYQTQILASTKSITEKKLEADKLVAQCEEAYRITTTKGLAAAFDQRANKLSYSMWGWVGGLMLALSGGIYIGSHRFELLNSAISQQKDLGYVWVQIFLSVLSLGAPIWFAWIATKQIGQRFKLSEDYAFKASVAKAYEGYRKEASRIDIHLEKRLFSSALDRFEEPPLRVMEKEHYGSPWHEVVSSDQFKNAINTFPELKEKIMGIIRTKSDPTKENTTESPNEIK